MNKSFFDRLFPRSSGHTLPQYERESSTSPRTPQLLSASPNIELRANRRSTSNSSETSSRKPGAPRSVPLGASFIHHDDPFLPIERAAKALQENIQSLLDAQSASLSGRSGLQADDTLSNGSLTPTQSVVMGSQRTSPPKTVPVRQPTRKKITLKAARKGIATNMYEFASLKEEESRLLKAESRSRTEALETVNNLNSRRDALTTEIQALGQENTSAAAQDFRTKAKAVESEIRELEHRLLELKVRHRHLLSQADQVENSVESKASSYRNSLSLVEKDIKEFLKQPPIARPFAKSFHPGMYDLNPDRRTLQMAKEQWQMEQESISEYLVTAKTEESALLSGRKLWVDAVKRIGDFERNLLFHTKTVSNSVSLEGSPPPRNFTNEVLKELEELIESLDTDFVQAEEKGWNLLVCAIGAERQACIEARALLGPSEQIDIKPSHDVEERASHLLDERHNGAHGVELVQLASQSPTGSEGSNQSLKDTLAAFGDEQPVLHRHEVGSHDHSERRYESEDDEPPADFLLSQPEVHQ